MVKYKNLIIRASELLKYNYSKNYIVGFLWDGINTIPTTDELSYIVEIAERYNKIYNF